MEPRQNEFSDHINGFTLYDEDILPIFDQNPGLANEYKFKDEHLDLSFLEHPYTAPDPNPGSLSVSPGMLAQVESPDEFNDYVFKFIDQILVEEDDEDIQSMFCDPLDLQATERSLYQVLGEAYPSSSQPPLTLSPNVENTEDNVFGSSGEYSTNSSTSNSNSTHPDWPGSYTFDSLPPFTKTQSLENPPLWSFGSTTSDVGGTMDEMLSTQIAQNIFTDSESIKQFNKGMEEASKFLPSSKPLVIDLDDYDLPSDSRDAPPEVVVKEEKVEKEKPSNGVRGRKHYQLEDNDYPEERSSKQSAVYVEEDELSEMFDRVLLGADANGKPIACCKEPPILVDNKSQKNGLVVGSNNGRNAHPQRKKTNEAVDISTLLLSCAQSVAVGDRRTANEQLNQIRQHASTSGDASQRLAHVFAIGIEARLAGTGSQLYAAKSAFRISAAEKLQAYQVYLSACPFKKIAMFFANKMIYEASSNSSTLHIVDFGIAYGFQWPILIKHLSERPGGAPKLRITGIEFPQPGFRPAERLEETGRRLANYCERFNVSFEYNAIASQNWDTIKIDDLKLQRNEFLAVNTLIRFKNLLDETVVVESPRDKVLKLIRDMKPDIFVHGVVNGSYSAPFFVTRFRETLFHYSALFDMFDATIERENEHRLNFEKEFYGREAMNVIACEGADRVERPETYKQWQVRISRAGFKMKPLNQEIVSKLRCKVRGGYHKDFKPIFPSTIEALDLNFPSTIGVVSSRGKKNRQAPECGGYEQHRSNKHLAGGWPEEEQMETKEIVTMIDKLLLCPGSNHVGLHDELACCPFDRPVSPLITGKQRRKRSDATKEIVDLKSLLTQCAQAVSSNNKLGVERILKKIRNHSSPRGDSEERLAHYFADALDARYAGTGMDLYSNLALSKIMASDIVKAYQVYVSTCPFKKMSNIYANKMIGNLARGSPRLHIIDFGILYGFQWPCLIQGLSARLGGTPRLRITGIDFPQPGFRPAERVEETGRRLADYCKRFNVPFEYHAIARQWDDIKLEDLKINEDEILVVNCLYRLRNVPDETVLGAIDCPRESVLKLIKMIKPNLFLHGVVNGNYNAPFFLTRFREAYFNFSVLFNMFEAAMNREDEERLLFEKEVIGREVINVIACEGTRRIERPETYKQWQARNERAGFTPVPMNGEIMKEVRAKVKIGFHRDFMVDDDGHWMVQGWKGR
ncbi:Transcription factor GRAS, partial [Cynara cardunculus var. scolymus]